MFVSLRKYSHVNIMLPQCVMNSALQNHPESIIHALCTGADAVPKNSNEGHDCVENNTLIFIWVEPVIGFGL